MKQPVTVLDIELNDSTSEFDLGAWVDEVKQAPELRGRLVDVLPESHFLYKNRGTNTMIRMRGYVMAAFEKVGLPESAIPFIVDELENGRDAYLVASAAKAVRGSDIPGHMFIPFLVKALQNVRYEDEALSFDEYAPTWPVENHTSALLEIIETLRLMGREALQALPALEDMVATSTLPTKTRSKLQEAIAQIRDSATDPVSDCCSPPQTFADAMGSCSKKVVASEGGGSVAESSVAVAFEDQQGQRISYKEYFRGAPAIVVFFYTRCENPNKCSLTVTKLARLQEQITIQDLKGELKTAAITYDPGYDLPARLHAYCKNRGMVFGANHRALRAMGGFNDLIERFQLGVNFNGSIVNQHRIELFILDKAGNVAFEFTRMQWDIDEVLSLAKSLLN